MDAWGFVVSFALLWFALMFLGCLIMTLHEMWPTFTSTLADQIERLHQRLQLRRVRRKLEKRGVLR
jgi:hypothetical protein